MAQIDQEVSGLFDPDSRPTNLQRRSDGISSSGHLTTAHRHLLLPLPVAEVFLGSDRSAGSSGKRVDAVKL
ncbi:hypothetical protein RchiOBHm_Chr3g0475581 [Rosa chinensis]|uniref:Uncharacterized protein n=1 Tax=Rosa chinensis TaxID=74649 RepID=A0A2P6RCE6_ROSCH|nr:hypothetical protein RchiOBHm_Chr3g0475581 [Rosa chinensis]